MATNFHSDLPNDQLHNPKDFAVAHKNSVVTKNNSSQLNWARANYSLTSDITCQADAAGSLNDRSFTLCLNASVKYACYYEVSGYTSSFSPTPGYTATPIAISADATANQVATATASTLNALAGITATPAANVVSVSGMTSADPTTDVSTNFIITNTETPFGNEFLQTDGSGNIKWGSSPGGGGRSNSWGAINTPGGSFPTANGCGDTLVLNTDDGSNIEIVGDNTSDTVTFKPHQTVQFRGNVELGLSAATKYVFRQDNNKDQKFQQSLGASGVINAAQVINAAKMYPNPGSVLKSVKGFISAPIGVTGRLYLYRYALVCEDAEAGASITPQLAAASNDMTFLGNNVPLCFDMAITTLTYGSHDLLVPVFEWTSEEPGNSARTFWKITMY